MKNNNDERVIQEILTRVNVSRLMVIFAVLFMVEALFLIYVERLRLLEATGDLAALIRVSYLLHTILALVIILMTGGFYLLRTRFDIKSEVYRRLPLFAVFVVLIISATISLFDQLTTGHIMLYGVKLILFGLLLYIKPPYNFFVYGVPSLLFFIGIFFFQGDPAYQMTHFIYGGALIGGVLVASTKFYTFKVGDISQRLAMKRLNKELEHLSTLDALTKLPNRRYFEKQVRYEMAINRRYQQQASLVLFDIDDFKAVNDTYGHQIGDEILKGIAEILLKDVRESDTVARWGGEEFMLLLSHTAVEGAKVLAERLLKRIEATTFTLGIKITVSIGITLLESEGETPFKTSYERADKALYQSKENGKNQISIIT